MYLSDSKCWYSNNYLQFLKHPVTLSLNNASVFYKKTQKLFKSFKKRILQKVRFKAGTVLIVFAISKVKIRRMILYFLAPGLVANSIFSRTSFSQLHSPSHTQHQFFVSFRLNIPGQMTALFFVIYRDF
jgi:hypothetical protein